MRVLVIAQRRCHAAPAPGSSNLRLCPILRMPPIFEDRLQRAERIGRDLVGREPGREQAGAFAGLLVAERHVAGFVRRQRQRDAAHLRLHRIDELVSASMAKWPRSCARASQSLAARRACARSRYFARSNWRSRAAAARAAASALGREDDVALFGAVRPCRRRARWLCRSEQTAPVVLSPEQVAAGCARRRRRPARLAAATLLFWSSARRRTGRSANIRRRVWSAWRIPSPSGRRSACAHPARARQVRPAARRA